MMQHEGACRFSTEVLRRMDPLCRWGVVILIVALGSPLTGADTPPRTANNVVAGEKPANAEGENTAEHPLVKAIGLAESSRESLKEVKDYTALFIKTERIKGRVLTQEMDMKIREEPFGVYLKFRNPHRGREVIYAEGKYSGNLKVHEDGLKKVAGTLSLPPTGPDAMAENLYPISKIGMANFLDDLIEQWQNDTKFGESKVQYFPNAKLGQAKMPCMVIEVTHPQPRKQFRYHMTRLYIEKENNLPIRLEQYAWPQRPGEEPPKIEEYNYTNLKLNVGLTDKDFDTRNPGYQYPNP